MTAEEFNDYLVRELERQSVNVSDEWALFRFPIKFKGVPREASAWVRRVDGVLYMADAPALVPEGETT